MLSREEIEHLAQLARITLREEEIAGLQKDISNILEYVGQVSGVSAPAHTDVVPEHRNVMRPDTPREEGDPLAHKEEALRAAFPRREDDFAVVRQILQKDE